MEPLDPELRALIDEGLPAAMPSDAAEARGLQALLAQVDAPPAPAAGAPAAAGLAKLVLVVAAAATVGGAGWLVTRPAPQQPVATAQRPAPKTPAKPTPPPSPAPPSSVPLETPVVPAAPQPVAPVRPTRTRTAAPTPPPPAPSVADALRAEADLIARAESALDRGKPKEALVLCEFHETGFDRPQLATERQAIAASAACMVDATNTAAAQAFVRQHPRSALARKVQRRCGLKPSQP
jgi:hypothetical protein